MLLKVDWAAEAEFNNAVAEVATEVADETVELIAFIVALAEE